ncbi:hypothetical protein [Methylomonas rosea]|uniref:Uncharacterized protein n=1 Tax=Methylomonas rosea TaxID=2952227 RepID=A0ABT1TX16_9GAMM|nr:hypothetical protein [Methylomonas sp. WSC-7]MCQ8119315.1 hypothetical protein [Methylomonas sp. WSC-7]
MQSLFMRVLTLIASLLAISGCAEVDSSVREHFPTVYSAPVVHSDIDELLDFGNNLVNMTTASRTETCRSLVKRQKDEPEIGVLLHLMVGRLLSDACGDIPKILDEIAGIPPSSLSDERMRHLVAINTEALKRINSASKRLGSLERKQKTVQNVLETKDATGSKKEESRLLREKLEAIRSMEKQLDETSEGK